VHGFCKNASACHAVFCYWQATSTCDAKRSAVVHHCYSALSVNPAVALSSQLTALAVLLNTTGHSTFKHRMISTNTRDAICVDFHGSFACNCIFHILHVQAIKAYKQANMSAVNAIVLLTP
jgi:hypothetical protein